MVILISAPSCSGKTLLAQQLMKKYHMTYYSMDHIKMGLIRGLETDEFRIDITDDEMTVKIWPIIKGIVMTAIENQQHLIIEGVYVKPSFLKEFDPIYRNEIVPIFMCFTESYLQQNFTDKILKCRNIIESRLYEEDRPLEYFICAHHEMKYACEQEGIPYFIADHSYETMIHQIFSYVEIEVQAHIDTKKNKH